VTLLEPGAVNRERRLGKKLRRRLVYRGERTDAFPTQPVHQADENTAKSVSLRDKPETEVNFVKERLVVRKMPIRL